MHFKGIRRFIGLGLAVLAVIGATSAIVFAIVLATLSSCVHHALFEVASGLVDVRCDMRASLGILFIGIKYAVSKCNTTLGHSCND